IGTSASPYTAFTVRETLGKIESKGAWKIAIAPERDPSSNLYDSRRVSRPSATDKGPAGSFHTSPEIVPSNVLIVVSPAKRFAPSARAASSNAVPAADCVCPGISQGFTWPLPSAVANGVVYMYPCWRFDSALLFDVVTPSL